MTRFRIDREPAVSAHERLAVPERKAGHSTAFPLTGSVGEALVEYLRHGRPQTGSRRVFFRALAPVEPTGPAAVSARAAHYLRKAEIEVPRPDHQPYRGTVKTCGSACHATC